MKEKWLRAGKITLIVLGILLLLFLIGFGRHFLFTPQVEKMTLTAWDGDSVQTIELTDAEIFGFTAIYNLSRYAGEVTAEGCSVKFVIRMYCNNGDNIRIEDHKDARMKVTGIDTPGFRLHGTNGSFWVDNPLLLGYIKMLANAHGLEWETWATCEYGC